jgi:predicted ester cyclase
MAEIAGSNVERMRAFVKDVQQNGNLELFDRFIHPDCRDHPLTPGQPNDCKAIRGVIEGLHDSFSDIKVEILHCVEHDGTVATNKILSGVLVKEWNGMVPDGKRVQMRIMDFVRFHEGRMIEHWATANPLGDG